MVDASKFVPGAYSKLVVCPRASVIDCGNPWLEKRWVAPRVGHHGLRDAGAGQRIGELPRTALGLGLLGDAAVRVVGAGDERNAPGVGDAHDPMIRVVVGVRGDAAGGIEPGRRVSKVLSM